MMGEPPKQPDLKPVPSAAQVWYLLGFAVYTASIHMTTHSGEGPWDFSLPLHFFFFKLVFPVGVQRFSRHSEGSFPGQRGGEMGTLPTLTLGGSPALLSPVDPKACNSNALVRVAGRLPGDSIVAGWGDGSKLAKLNPAELI